MQDKGQNGARGKRHRGAQGKGQNGTEGAELQEAPCERAGNRWQQQSRPPAGLCMRKRCRIPECQCRCSRLTSTHGGAGPCRLMASGYLCAIRCTRGICLSGRRIWIRRMVFSMAAVCFWRCGARKTGHVPWIFCRPPGRIMWTGNWRPHCHVWRPVAAARKQSASLRARRQGSLNRLPPLESGNGPRQSGSRGRREVLLRGM